MKKNDLMFELLESYNDSEDIGPNLWFFIYYLKSKKHKIVYKPIIQILDHSDEWLSFIDFAIINEKVSKNYYLIHSDHNTKDSDKPVIIAKYNKLPNNLIIKKKILSILKKKRFPDIKMVCNMVYLNENFRWNVNELVKFFKPFHKYRLKIYKQVENDEDRPPYQYFSIWLKYLKEEVMKKEPSDFPKYTKVRRCITPEGEIVKNQLNPNKDFN